MQRGYLAISSILIISAVVLAITVSVSYLSIGEGQASLALTKGEQELTLLESCAEDILLKLRSNTTLSFFPSGEVLPEGNCNIYYGDDGNNNYTFNILSQNTSYNRYIQIVVNRDYSITMTSWKEM